MSNKYVGTDIPEDRHVELKIKAAKQGRTIADILRELIDKFLSNGKAESEEPDNKKSDE